LIFYAFDSGKNNERSFDIISRTKIWSAWTLFCANKQRPEKASYDVSCRMTIVHPFDLLTHASFCINICNRFASIPVTLAGIVDENKRSIERDRTAGRWIIEQGKTIITGWRELERAKKREISEKGFLEIKILREKIFRFEQTSIF